MEAKGLYVVIPAYNEEAGLEKVLQDLDSIRKRNTGMIKKIIVVNDGSTDNTGKIAEKYADQVIHLNENKGKARAFWEGLKQCQREKAKIMVTLDADLKRVSEEQLKKLAGPLGKRKKSFAPIQMVVGNRRKELLHGLSGDRAFLLEAFDTFMHGHDLRDVLPREGKKRVGAGLELFLNSFFSGREWVAQTNFEVGPATTEKSRPGRTKRDRRRFNAELGRMTKFFQTRRRRR